VSRQSEELLERLAVQLCAVRLDHPLRVAIDGVDAAGKTVLADNLAPQVEALGRPVIRASVDGFHNPAEVRRRRGTLSPEGYYHDSFDYSGLVAALLRPLGPGGDRAYRTAIFDYRADSPVAAEPKTAPPDSVLLFDGVFLLRSELHPYWDFSVFVRAGFRVTLPRAVKRDLELFGDAGEVRQRYERRYIPGQMLYIAESAPEEHATVIIDNNDPEEPFFS
jgi:uridine kinase